MSSFMLAFFVSLVITLCVIRYQHIHGHITFDGHLGPQKIHSVQTPRIGGISIFLALLAGICLQGFYSKPEFGVKLQFFTACTPAFLVGLTEDLTKRLSVKARLFYTAAGSVLSILTLEILIYEIQLPLIDWLLNFTIFAWFFTIIAIVGLTNAYNIIDGLNGLASMVGIITLLGISYVAFLVSDQTILSLALIMVGAIAGFFIWNYPRGLIFLGDCGAYLIGFYIAVLSILLIKRHGEISPWFALLVNIYPIFETIFTMWRRKIHKGKNPGLPDCAHFHSILYRRILIWAAGTYHQNTASVSNSRTSPYLWLLSSLAVFPAVLWWRETIVLQSFALLFCISYLYLYRSVLTFRKPRRSR